MNSKVFIMIFFGGLYTRSLFGLSLFWLTVTYIVLGLGVLPLKENCEKERVYDVCVYFYVYVIDYMDCFYTLRKKKIQYLDK